MLWTFLYVLSQNMYHRIISNIKLDKKGKEWADFILWLKVLLKEETEKLFKTQCHSLINKLLLIKLLVEKNSGKCLVW